MHRQFLLAFFIFICYFSSPTVVFSQNLSKDVCNRQIMLLESAPIRRLFKQANAYIPRDLSVQRPFFLIDDFNKCLSINELVNGTTVQGKYCTISVTIPNPWNSRRNHYIPDNKTVARAEEYAKIRQSYRFFVLQNCPSTFFKSTPRWKQLTKNVRFGVCIPKVCSTKDALEFVMNNRPLTYEDDIIEEFEFNDNNCKTYQEMHLTIGDYICIFVFGLIFIITTASTIYDMNHQIFKKLDSKPNRVYSSFSVYTNTSRLINSTSSISPDTVLCVNGIIAISIVWEIAAHTNRNAHSYLDNQWSDFRHYFYETSHYIVDTFFLLSGFFVVYTNIKKYTAASFVKNIPRYYLNRLLRLYPILCSLLLLDISLFKHLRDSLDIIQLFKMESCVDLWWHVLLFINNIVFNCDSMGIRKWCLMQSWFLSVDMQLYLISPLVMIWLFGNKKVAWTALSIALVSSLTVCTILTFLWNFPFLMHSSLLPYNKNEIWIFYYNNTLYRSPPYFIGMMLAYCLHCLRGKKIIVSKIMVCFLWCLIFFIGVWSFYITKEMVYTYNQTLNNLLGAYQRSIWSLAIALIIFTCQCGYGGPVNWFLSLNMWKLLSRLNYAMFLSHVHYSIIIKIVIETSVVSETSDWTDLQRFACVYMMTFIMSVALVVLFEMPVMNLQAVIQGSQRSKIILKKEIHAKVTTEDIQNQQ